jgi:hypothetical protein
MELLAGSAEDRGVPGQSILRRIIASREMKRAARAKWRALRGVRKESTGSSRRAKWQIGKKPQS